VEIYLRSEERIVAGFSLFLDEGEENPANMDIKKLEQLHSFMQFSLETCLNTPQQRSFETTCDKYQLTGKERMVVEQVLQGLPNKSIATNLCCSLPTIKTHLQNIFEKINVNSKAELTSLLYMQRN
jgi:DNA-binding NarL/FixJ family response regulator